MSGFLTTRWHLNSKALHPGTVIFAVQPHSYVLSQPRLSAACAMCCSLGMESGLKRCTKCRETHYCSSVCRIQFIPKPFCPNCQVQECQNADWPIHKMECEALQRWKASVPKERSEDITVTTPADSVRCLGRMVWRRKKEGSDSLWVRSAYSHLWPCLIVVG